MHEVTLWTAALLTLAGLGLTLGLNPALYGATAEILARNSRIVSSLAALVGGLLLGATVLYALLQSVDPSTFVADAERGASEAVLDRRVDLAAGVVFLIGGVAVAWWRLRVPVRAHRAPKPPRTSALAWSYFALGASCSVIGFTTLPIMYMTGRVTDGLTDVPALRIAAYAVFLVALAAPFVLLAAAWLRFPVTAARVNRLYLHALGLDHRWLYAAVLGVAGIACLVLGLLPGR